MGTRPRGRPQKYVDDYHIRLNEQVKASQAKKALMKGFTGDLFEVRKAIDAVTKELTSELDAIAQFTDEDRQLVMVDQTLKNAITQFDYIYKQVMLYRKTPSRAEASKMMAIALIKDSFEGVFKDLHKPIKHGQPAPSLLKQRKPRPKKYKNPVDEVMDQFKRDTAKQAKEYEQAKKAKKNNE